MNELTFIVAARKPLEPHIFVPCGAETVLRKALNVVGIRTRINDAVMINRPVVKKDIDVNREAVR